jgi:hypothetical protein
MFWHKIRFYWLVGGIWASSFSGKVLSYSDVLFSSLSSGGKSGMRIRKVKKYRGGTPSTYKPPTCTRTHLGPLKGRGWGLGGDAGGKHLHLHRHLHQRKLDSP